MPINVILIVTLKSLGAFFSIRKENFAELKIL